MALYYHCIYMMLFHIVYLTNHRISFCLQDKLLGFTARLLTRLETMQVFIPIPQIAEKSSPVQKELSLELTDQLKAFSTREITVFRSDSEVKGSDSAQSMGAPSAMRYPAHICLGHRHSWYRLERKKTDVAEGDISREGHGNYYGYVQMSAADICRKSGSGHLSGYKRCKRCQHAAALISITTDPKSLIKVPL